MAYDNLTNITTSVSGAWTSSGFSYADLPLEAGIIHKDQIEVERVFTIDSDTRSKMDPYDLHRVFLVQKADYTVDESTKKITAISYSGSTTYTIQKGTKAGTTITIPVISTSHTVTVRRKTYSGGTYVTWNAGSRLTSNQLNHQVSQLLRLNQELIYKLENEYVRAIDLTGSSAPQLVFGQPLLMGNNQIKQLLDPTDSTDAATKAYVDANAVTTTGTQTINGAKTFSSLVTASSGIAGNVTGNVTGNLSGTVTTAAQTSITSLGTLTSLAVSGATTLSSTLAVTGAITATGGVVGNLTGNATTATTATSATAATTAGTVTTAAQPNITSVGTLTSLTVSGNISASTAPSSGAHLANKTYVDTKQPLATASAGVAGQFVVIKGTVGSTNAALNVLATACTAGTWAVYVALYGGAGAYSGTSICGIYNYNDPVTGVGNGQLISGFAWRIS